MSNPILNDKNFKRAAAELPPPQVGTVPPPGQSWPAPGMPIDDGPISTWRSGVMTVQGTLTKTAILFALLLATAVAGWTSIEPETNAGFPATALVGVLVGFGALIACYFKPAWAKFLAPVYALGQGFFIGVVSRYYDYAYDGIVLQAAGATLATFAVMLFMYRTGVIRVTDRFRRIVIGATMGVMLLYGVSLLLMLFGVDVSFLDSTNASPVWIAFSVFVCVLAALNLALDFDFIEKGSRAGLAKDMEWVGALGLMVTIIWLYLEILRLLARLRNQ